MNLFFEHAGTGAHTSRAGRAIAGLAATARRTFRCLPIALASLAIVAATASSAAAAGAIAPPRYDQRPETRALIAEPVAMAADTPQIEIPEASGAAHSRLNLK